MYKSVRYVNNGVTNTNYCLSSSNVGNPSRLSGYGSENRKQRCSVYPRAGYSLVPMYDSFGAYKRWHIQLIEDTCLAIIVYNVWDYFKNIIIFIFGILTI